MPTDTSGGPEIGRYLSGEALYGDDFTDEQIRAWFAEEKEAYASLGARDRDSYRYQYHELNQLHLFRHIGDRRFPAALGIGSAYGDEFLPLAERIDRITILEPSIALAGGDNILGTPCEWVQPQASGNLPFEAGAFDLVTSLGALHHIPNVSHVVKECHRVLTDDGVLLVREPIVSMGDWSKPRYGVTRHERGIPLDLFLEMVGKAGFEVAHKSLCVFPLVPKLGKAIGVDQFNKAFLTRADALLSKSMQWNVRYHATTLWQKIRPTALAMVLTKQR